jgi:hypothetical protein
MFVTKTSLNILKPISINEIKHFRPKLKVLVPFFPLLKQLATFHETSYKSYATGKYPNMELL